MIRATTNNSTMPAVEEARRNSKGEYDSIPTIRSEVSNKNPWSKRPKTKRQLSVKQQQLAEEAARAWASAVGVSWNDFTQTTTFHGIRYIFDSSPQASMSRRLTWVACVLAAVLFFIIQVSLRVGVFFQYNTNVDVEKVYTTTVPLPAVTICNQNKFRLTVTAEKGLYRYTDAVFGGLTNVARKEQRQHNREIRARDFLMETAHRLDDLIDSCTWKGKQCNMTTDWLERQTDMGVCYTFNSGLNGEPAREVTESGAAQGLSLILNIEQYEYMMGPQNDAGIKILLHDQSEFPMIKDLGFAVAPGTHTLVGVNRFVIESMEHPYGPCDKKRNEPMSDCRVACYTREIVSRCGCRDLYMGNETDVPFCDIPQTFGCVRDEMERMQTEENNCSCTVPCTRINYEPALSYAQLSQLSIGRLVLKNPERRKAVHGQFALAREMLQRTDESILETDAKIHSRIRSLIQDLTDTVTVAMTDIRAAREETWINNLESSLGKDKFYLSEQMQNDIWPAIWNITTEFKQYTECIQDTVQFVGDFRPPQLGSPDPQSSIVECLTLKCTPAIVSPNYRTQEERMGENDAVKQSPQDTESCMKLADVLDSILLLPNKYARAINDLFAGSLSDPSEIPDHLSCLVELDKIEDSNVVNATRQLTTLMRSMFENTQQQRPLRRGNEPADVMNKTFARELKTFYMKASEVCTWPKDHFPSDDKALLSDINLAGRSLKALKTAYSEFKNDVSSIDTILKTTITVARESVENYTAGDITKMELASTMRSRNMLRGLDDLEEYGQALDRALHPINNHLTNIENDLLVGFDKLFNVDIPLMTQERIGNLSFLSFASGMGVDKISALYHKLSKNYHGNIDKIVVLMSRNIGEYIRPMKKELVGSMKAAESALTEFSEELFEYQISGKMNQGFFMQNFLQVDVFYRELNSEYIIQRPAFAASSLLGEVGGFLGLLLGASILTVCELLDYLFMSCWLKIQKRTMATFPGIEQRPSETL